MAGPRGWSVVSAVRDAGVLDAVEPFDPVAVGTCPLGLDRDGSDVDILCFAPDLEAFLAQAAASFGTRPGFRTHRRSSDGCRLGGEPLARRVRDARRDGDSVEVAFADVLRLRGAPYMAVLDLADESDGQLRRRIAAAT